ncbi:MAG: response regulator [Chloroflexota bacterium]
MSESTKILVIDDDVSVHKLIEMALTKQAVDFAFVKSAVQGMRLIDELQPHIIIMDLLLPDSIKGWDAIQQLKAHEDTREIPILVITAGNNQHISRAMNAGADTYLTKPFKVRDLQSIVASYMSAIHS